MIVETILKLHGRIYEFFGYYTKYARRKEQEHVKSLGELSEFETNLAIGMWQIKYGFCRSSKHLMKRIKRFKK
jgi:hypothetical protein